MRRKYRTGLPFHRRIPAGSHRRSAGNHAGTDHQRGGVPLCHPARENRALIVPKGFKAPPGNYGQSVKGRSPRGPSGRFYSDFFHRDYNIRQQTRPE